MADVARGAEPVAEPRVSVIVPCYDDGELVREAVGSIVEPEPIDVIVVDDASSDPTTRSLLAEIDELPGVRVVSHEHNQGLIAARGTGLAASRSRYVFNLDADDLAVEGAISAMADLLDASPGKDVCYGDYLEFGTHSALRAVPSSLDLYRLAYTNEYPVTALFRRSVLEEVDGWRACGYSETAYEDWNLWITLAERGVGVVYFGLERPTFQKRFHGVRMLLGARPRHSELYKAIAAAHPRTFGELRRLRSTSDLSPARRFLYPIVYGGRKRHAWEPKLKRKLDELGVWTLIRRSR